MFVSGNVKGPQRYGAPGDWGNNGRTDGIGPEYAIG